MIKGKVYKAHQHPFAFNLASPIFFVENRKMPPFQKTTKIFHTPTVSISGVKIKSIIFCDSIRKFLYVFANYTAISFVKIEILDRFRDNTKIFSLSSICISTNKHKFIRICDSIRKNLYVFAYG